MPLTRENSQLYEVIKVSTISGQPLFVSGVTTISGGTVSVTGAVSVTDNNSSLTVDGKAYRSIVSFTRPNDASGYIAGDVLGASGSAVHTLSGAGPSGGFVILQSASLIFSDSTVPSGMGAFRVHFFMDAPTAITDNAPFDLTSGDRTKYAGYVDMPTPLDFGSTIYTQVDYPGRTIKLTSGTTNLSIEIETRGAYTPVSGSTVQFRANFLEAGL